MVSFYSNVRQPRNRPISIAKAIRMGKIRDNIGSGVSILSPNIIMLGAGQSNMAYWSGSAFSHTGEDNLLSRVNSGNPSGSNGFINAGDGSSYLSRQAYNAAQTRVGGTLQVNDYWVNDTTGTLSAGQRLLDALDDLSAAGKALGDVRRMPQRSMLEIYPVPPIMPRWYG
jgi:hypothetical protein